MISIMFGGRSKQSYYIHTKAALLTTKDPELCVQCNVSIIGSDVHLRKASNNSSYCTEQGQANGSTAIRVYQIGSV